MKQLKYLVVVFLIAPTLCFSQQLGVISVTVTGESSSSPIPYATVVIGENTHSGMTNENGQFVSKALPFGNYLLRVKVLGFMDYSDTVALSSSKIEVKAALKAEVTTIKKVIIKNEQEALDYKLKAVDDMLIAHGKKSEVIDVDQTDGNKGANNAREIYSRITGLNIWESDGAGIQLGIGGRGLSPSRTANFNTRQNGYDISADALGYPESYYTPTSAAIQRIQLIRGAASLQFGTQFGGLLNFVMKEGGDKKAELVYRQTKASFGLDDFFASVGGTVKSLNYYVYGNYKNGNDWRPNAGFDVYSAGVNLKKNFGKKTSLRLELTKMYYLTQQPGGLTDAQFNLDPSVSFRDRNWFRVDWNLGALTFKHEFKNKSKLESKLFGLIASREALGFLGQINRTDPIGERTLIFGEFKNWGNEARWLKTYQYKKQLWTGLVGFRVYQGNSFSRQGAASANSDADFNFLHQETDGSAYEFPSANYAVFAEHIFQLNDKLGITPGLRFEHIRTKAQGEYLEVIQDLAGNVIFDSLYSDVRTNSRNIVIAGVGLNYQLKKHHRVYANFSQNYRSINFTDMQIQNPNFKIDPNLQDEKGFNADLGFQGSQKGKLYYDVSLFLLAYNNRIGTTIEVDPVWYTTYQYRTNISASLTKGVEAMVEYDFWHAFSNNDSTDYSLRGFTNLSLVDARYIDSKEPAFDGKKVELVPPVTVKAGVRFQYKTFVASYQFSYTYEHFSDASNSVSQGNAVNGIIPSYYVSDLALKYAIGKFQFETGVNNLFNQSYFTRRASGYPGPGIIPAAPRSFYIGVQLKI